MNSPAVPQPTADTRSALRSLAVKLAAFTVAWNVIEGLGSLGFGLQDESVALLGFGADSWVEVFAALVVLWRLRAEAGQGVALERAREKRATLVIGVLLCVLAVGAMVGAGLQLFLANQPETSLPGLVISLVSLGFMGALWRAKLRVARALDSRTLMADAACSRGCLELSAVLFAGSLLGRIAPGLWWADAVAALVLALLIGREGMQTISAARKPDFTGGCCGCGH